MRTIITKIHIRLLMMILGVLLLVGVPVQAGEEDCALSPRLAWIHGEVEAAEIYVWDSATGETTNVSQNPTGDFNPVWSNDGRLAWLSYVSGAYHLIWTLVSEVYVWDSTTGEITNVSGDSPGTNRDLTWSNDGRLAWSDSGRNSGDVFVWDSTTEEVSNVSNGWNSVEISLTFSSDGKLAWMSGPGESCLWQIYVLNPTGRAPINVSQNRGCNMRPAWSNDGRLAWISNLEGDVEIHVWDSTTGETINVFGDSSIVDSNLLWSTDGHLAWNTGHVYVWDGVSGETINASRGQGCVEYMAWSPDGQLSWVCSYDGADIYVLNSLGGVPVNISQHPSQYFGSPSWSPDGRLAWASDQNGNAEIYMWDSTTGEIVNVSTNPALDSNPVWSPAC
jgi:Tol biopolymer transport system component